MSSFMKFFLNFKTVITLRLLLDKYIKQSIQCLCIFFFHFSRQTLGWGGRIEPKISEDYMHLIS
uniref:Uncharacterized protein n=1 Tax=Nelumbo nucifera TaxID=4432 RepID=A0A822YZ05_NELNU|nr:TPA_asm: hypothetical protein HUJ06_008114 [Nelumbo nucifera]